MDERAIERQHNQLGANPNRLCAHLAAAKALSVSHKQPIDLVIGADQILALDDLVLHKPKSPREAQARLNQLSGRSHRLHTAFALAIKGEILASHSEIATLTVRHLEATEIEALIAQDPNGALDTPGAYKLETPGIQIFEKIEGDHFAILGLPLLPLLAALRTHAPHLMLSNANQPSVMHV